jgi:signal transduction histidine kinase
VVRLDSPLTRLLQGQVELIRTSACTEPEMMPVASALGVLGCELVTSIKANDGRLIGFLCPGRKRDGSYSVEDEQLIKKTSSRLGVTVENAYLFRSEQALRREIEREVKDRTEFLVAAAHEMRTPLTSIMAAGEMLAGEVPSNPESPLFQLVDNIRVAADSLHNRTSELLEFARMRSGALDLKINEVEVNQIISGMPRQFAPILRQREQELVIETSPTPLVVNADYNRLQQVITNLLSNAAKFSPLKARLVLKAETNGDEAVIRVVDRATPLSDIERSKMFQPFYRGENLRKPGTGLGLGLAISRQIVASHQGRIWVDVTSEGNIFSFSIPLAPPEKLTA